MQVQDFHQKHKGKLAFVLGCGPSLHFDKLTGITDFVTFAVNASILKVRKSDYFVTTSSGALDWDWYHKTLSKFDGVSFLPRQEYQEMAYHIRSHVFFETNQWFNPLTKTFDSSALRVSDDPKKPLVASRSSCGAAIHLANLMGCSPIVLLGNDCCYVGEKGFYYEYPGEHKPHRRRGRPSPVGPRHMVRGKMLSDDHKEIIDYWQQFAKINPYLNIISCSSHSMLDCFPMMSFGDVVKRYEYLRKESI